MLEDIIYSNVVTREIVSLVLSMAALYDLEVRAAEILNAYVMIPNREMMYIILGLEFGDVACKFGIIVGVLYW